MLAKADIALVVISADETDFSVYSDWFDEIKAKKVNCLLRYKQVGFVRRYRKN
ncbi:MAG: hypothetical protein L6V93_06785 [Clostridiales bacterium]|nr:MAG: hypothetical protein L6V93_06785 [Clostridiales bacterium]